MLYLIVAAQLPARRGPAQGQTDVLRGVHPVHHRDALGGLGTGLIS